MAIHETKKQSAAYAKSYGEPRSQSERDLEKRLKILRQQIYGSEKFNFPHPTSNAVSIKPDISYLYHDLIKIAILSGLAISTQIILFILIKNNILQLNFF